MTLRTWTVIGLLAVASAVGAAVVVGQAARKSTPDKPTAPLPALYVPDDQQDLGDVWEAPDAALPVVIANRSDKDVEIAGFEKSCTCGEVSPGKVTVPARGTATVSVKKDLSARSYAHVGLPRRKDGFTIVPVLAGGNDPPELTIRWTTRSAITPNQLDINFGDSNTAGQPPHARRIIVTAHDLFVALTATTDGGAVTVTATKVNDSRYDVWITPDTARPAGPFKAKVKLAWAVQGGTGTVVVPVEGTL